jgi:hypothetical protein
MKNKPKVIYLQVGETPESNDFEDLKKVNWMLFKSSDKDLEFVNAKEVRKLLKFLIGFQEKNGDWKVQLRRKIDNMGIDVEQYYDTKKNSDINLDVKK